MAYGFIIWVARGLRGACGKSYKFMVPYLFLRRGCIHDRLGKVDTNGAELKVNSILPSQILFHEF